MCLFTYFHLTIIFSKPVQKIVEQQHESQPLTPQSSLRDEKDKLRGGLEVEFKNRDDLNSTCTMGMTVKRNDVTGFLTNAHCSASGILPRPEEFKDTEYSIEGTVIAKESINRPVRLINDPRSPESLARFPELENRPPNNDCSTADVLFAERISGKFIVGQIAKPEGEVNSGNLEISGKFKVKGIKTSLSVGDEVHKVGRTTGWTSGKITRTCVTITSRSVGTSKYICQHFADYNQDGGDSGSAVFVRQRDENGAATDNIDIVGISHSSSDTESAFSPIQGVIDDLGGNIQFTKNK